MMRIVELKAFNYCSKEQILECKSVHLSPCHLAKFNLISHHLEGHPDQVLKESKVGIEFSLFRYLRCKTQRLRRYIYIDMKTIEGYARMIGE